jgi:hypothetical protein
VICPSPPLTWTKTSRARITLFSTSTLGTTRVL